MRLPLPEEKKRFDQFLQELQERGRSPRTLRAYQFDWSQFAGWYAEVNQEPFTLERLTAMDVQDYITWGRQQGLKATTLNRRLAWLKQYAAWGEQQGVVHRRHAPAHQGHPHSKEATASTTIPCSE